MTVDIQTKKYPEALRLSKQWVNMQVTRNETKDKYEKSSPMNSRSGQAARWSNPETWSAIEDAEAMYEARPDRLPTYIICAKDELVVIDCDNCYEGDTLKPYARYLVDLFESYTERSVSGRGIHIFVQGSTDLKLDTWIIHEGEEHRIEVFTDKHMITLTGDLIDPDLNDIQDGEEALIKLEAMVKPKPTVVVGQGNMTTSLTADQELIKLGSALETLSSSSYDEWRTVGMAMKLEGAQKGCEDDMWQLFDTWSRTTGSKNYDAEQNLKAWNKWSTTATGNEVTLGTVYHMAKEAGWVYDRRSTTSSSNGQKGGRPSLPLHADTARECFEDALIDEDSGLPTTLWRSGQWYDYGPLGWVSVGAKDVYSDIITYMHTRPDLDRCCNRSYFTSVQDNLTSMDLCGTKCDMPGWLTTGGSAENWVAFSDGWAVDVHTYAMIKAGLLPGCPESDYMKPLSPDLFSKAYVEYPFEGDRSIAMFRKYLDRVQPDPENQRMLRQMLGLLLSDETRYETCFAMIGNGANGKTVMLDIMTALVGWKNVCSVQLHRLNERFQTFPLVENKVNICGEMPTDVGVGSLYKVEGEFKNFISGGILEAERKGRDVVEARCRARFVFATNSLPTFVDKTNAIWRRLRIIDFPVDLPQKEWDVHLARKIIASEMTGILHWALEGLMEIVRDGSVYESQTSASLKQQHRLNCDREKSFLLEACKTDEGVFEPKDMLYATYSKWCRYNGRSNPLSKVNFLKRVKEIYPQVEECQRTFPPGSNRRVRCLSGIELLYEGAWREFDPEIEEIKPPSLG